MPNLSTIDIIVRLLVAFILSGIIGAEREWYRKPAGIRTLVMVGLGSALFTLASFRIREIFPGALADPGRIASQIVVGIGFIGAGAIIQAKRDVLGLTTAATIFVVAAIGLLAGYGLFTEAIAATVLTLLNFFGLSYVVQFIRRRSKVPEQEEEGDAKEIVMH